MKEFIEKAEKIKKINENKNVIQITDNEGKLTPEGQLMKETLEKEDREMLVLIGKAPYLSQKPMQFNEVAKLCHDIAKEKGWWDDPVRTFAECLLLVHSEVSEVCEAYRDSNLPVNKSYKLTGGKPEGVPIEIADVFIRLLDLCAFYEIDIDAAIKEKILYNIKRPYIHGNKRL